jgi:hypothetical protein
MENYPRPRKQRATFFKPGAGIGPAHLAHIQRAALVARASVADDEARAVLDDIADDAARVVSLCERGAQ